jgi:protein O-mannosyl-transferase
VKPDLKRYVTVTVFFVLALASKPMVITLPFVLLLLDFWPLQRVWKKNYPQPDAKEKKRREERSKLSLPGSPFPVVQLPFWQLVREKLPWVALCAASAIVTIIAQKSTGAIEATTRTHLGIRLENAINSYVGYIARAFWPEHLAVYYPYPYKGIAIWQVALASLFLLGISGLTWRQHATHPISCD